MLFNILMGNLENQKTIIAVFAGNAKFKIICCMILKEKYEM